METLNQPKIEEFAAATSNVLKIAFWRQTPLIADNLRALGKPVGARAARYMTERSTDVTRRNILENTFLLLGACFMTSPKTFEIVFLYLESFADALRGKVTVYATLDECASEFKYRAAAVERAYTRGDKKEIAEALVFADASLKAMFAKLHLIN